VDCAEHDEAHEVFEELVIACGDTAEVFEFIEEPFDKIALLVETLVIGFPNLQRSDGFQF